MKICAKCGYEKPLDDFYKQKTSSDGHGSYCKPCNKAEVKAYNDREPVKRKNNWTRGRVWSRYGIRLSVHDWDLLVAQKAEGCSICGSHTRLVIDHCHELGIIRGILCHTCNVGLGMFHDDTSKLTNAIQYLSSPPFGEGTA